MLTRFKPFWEPIALEQREESRRLGCNGVYMDQILLQVTALAKFYWVVLEYV